MPWSTGLVAGCAHRQPDFEAACTIASRGRLCPPSSMQTLKYARAAAVVQACSYKIDDRLLKEDLPWVGPAITKQILQILHTGSCEQLEQMRCTA